MFEVLDRFDPRTAAGLLAQAALRLDGPTVDARPPLVHDQIKIEESIIDELRRVLGIGANDHSPKAIEALTDALDKQMESVGQFNSEDITERLSAEGLLASDVYDIDYESHLPVNFGWRWATESQLATQTIRRPHREQVLGGGEDTADFPKITIFARFYTHNFPARSFWMLVIGGRLGKSLSVAQVWRVYPKEVDLSQCETLLDVLKAFSDEAGEIIDLGGERGKFFFRADAALISNGGLVGIPTRQGTAVTVTLFSHHNKNGPYVFLVVPVNLTRYFKTVENWRGWDRNILNDLDLTTTPTVAPAASPPTTAG